MCDHSFYNQMIFKEYVEYKMFVLKICNINLSIKNLRDFNFLKIVLASFKNRCVIF